MSISKQYTKEIKDKTNYLATWLPTVIVSPGDVGRIIDYQYNHVTTLGDLGIPVEIVPGMFQADFDYCSEGSVSINIKAAGKAPLAGSDIAEAEAGVSIKFARSNAVVFKISRCKSTRINDQNSLGMEILSRYRSGNWQDDWVVVTEVVSAAGATIIISSGDNAQIDLLAGGNVNASSLNLADVEANFQILKESNIETKIIASDGLTPLFKSSGIRRRFLRSPDFRYRGSDTQPRMEIVFDQMDYDDFAFSNASSRSFRPS